MSSARRAAAPAILLCACSGPPAAVVAPDAAPADVGPPDVVVDDGANGHPSDQYPAAHAPLPQLISKGGPVLATPRVMPIFFPGYAKKSAVTNATHQLAGSTYWSAVTAEYGVGPIEARAPVELAETPASKLTDSDVEKWLKSKLEAGDFGMPDPQTIYTVLYPTSTSVFLNGFLGSCTYFGGYHLSVDVAGKAIPYAVIAECDTIGNASGVDAVTGIMSHELAEAATDPFPRSNPAYAAVDPDSATWAALRGGPENADLCEFNADAFFTPPGFDSAVQRSWSNAAAAASHDPCVPAAPGPYFAAAPALPDTITFTGFGGTVTTKGLHLALGESKIVDLALFSDAKTSGPWTVTAKLIGSADISSSLDRASGVNGEILHLTVKAGNKPRSPITLELVSTLNGATHTWPMAVVVE